MTSTGDTPGGGHNGPQRGGRGRFERSPDTAEHDAEACRLRADGRTYAAIAEHLGYTHRSAARRAVARALAATTAEPAAELRTIELMKLDSQERAAWSVLHAEHVVVSGGRVVPGPDGQPMPDPMPVLRATDRLVRIAERRSRLLGLDAPTLLAAPSLADLDQQIAALEAELAGRDDGDHDDD